MPTDAIAGHSLSELLAEYAQGIAALRSRLGSDHPEEDEQTLLRFIIADNGNVEKAVDKALQGRQDRMKYAEVLKKAKSGEHLPQEAKIRKHLCFGRWQYPCSKSAVSVERPPLLITRSGHTNAKALMDSCTEDEVVEYFLWERQRAWDEVLLATKETGKLILMVSVNDLDGASLFTGRERRFFKAVGDSSKVGAGLFPLLTRKHVLVNGGKIIDILFSIVSMFMPQHVLDKVAFMNTTDFVSTFGVPSASIPDFIGGTCGVPADSPLALGTPQPAES
eukprot:gnl/MRDRNA2_/MRDRNA2_51916_c0_seq1.p1 gnl/MRDRNA2_/MRDRNA2_51916_c0~~gnl/MRDRNA2_/MRDRNA2_51916_c0_seq1.p1  ORF type:complete len:278 (+),score=60.89 gnl/MRDRNA2_/MRDRNA2_51916_c0_seq1:58-891(+)